MIEIIEGRGVGAGKSYYVVTRVIKHVVAGGTVYFSDTLDLLADKIAEYVEKVYGLVLEAGQMVAVPKEDVWRIHEVTPPGTDEMPVLIILDEVQRSLNARDWNDSKKRALFDWACESRHDSNDLIFISQNALNIDKQVARLATYITRVRNMVGFRMGGFSWPFKQFLIHVFDGDGRTSMEKKLIWHDKAIFGCYRSKSMRGSHRRLLADAVPKRKLQKVKTKGGKWMKFLVVMGVLIVVILAALGFKLYKQGGVPGFTKPVVAATAPAGVVGAGAVQSSGTSAVKLAWATVRETFLGASGGVLRTVESGSYIKGEMSLNGFVEGIQGHVVKCHAADGGTVFVVAVEGTKKDVVLSSAVSGSSAPVLEYPFPKFHPPVDRGRDETLAAIREDEERKKKNNP